MTISRGTGRLRGLLLATALIGVLSLVACAEVRYYGQAAQGHLDLMVRREPIAPLLVDPGLPRETRQRLTTALAARDFASAELALPDNGSYRRYTDLRRDWVTYALVSAPELSTAPRTKCFPLAGCVPYRGYFSRAAAEAEGARLRAAGDDVFLGPVPAYSTLGWFDDPLLNTMLALGEARMAGMIFHELAHQRVYVPGDSTFNESYATVVEEEGVRRWLGSRGATRALAAYEADLARESELRALLGGLRERLATLYAQPLPEAEKRAGKEALIEDTRRHYRALQAQHGWDGRFDPWFGPGLNNALLALLGTYGDQVGALRALLDAHGGDFAGFHRAVEALGELPKDRRHARLEALAAAG